MLSSRKKRIVEAWRQYFIMALPTIPHLKRAHIEYFFFDNSWFLLIYVDVLASVGEDSWESLGLQGDPTSPFWRRSALGSPLEGMMLKPKLQYFGHLMRRVDSLEKTLMLGGIEGRRRKGRQRMQWLDGITDSMDVSLSELHKWLLLKARKWFHHHK